MAVIRVFGAGALAALMAEERACQLPAPRNAGEGSCAANMDRRRPAGRRSGVKVEHSPETSEPAGGTPAVHIVR
jgi:hypothetical protein